MKKKYLVIGAGIGGLSAAGYLKQAGEDFIVIEKSKSVPNNLANGLHYLHSIDFDLPFKMEFKQCILTENVWDTKNNTFSDKAMLPDLFSYSRKIMDDLRHPSSIMDPGKSTRVFVPDSNDMNELIVKYTDFIGGENFIVGASIVRLDLKSRVAEYKIGEQTEVIEFDYLITTMPLTYFAPMVGYMETEDVLKYKPIHITNYKAKNVVPNWLIVLYMADQKFPPYRITCFNRIISMESLRELSHDDEVIIKYIIGDLFDYDLDSVSKYKWETGRIFGFDKDARADFIKSMAALDVYPVGRFALWNGKLRMDSTIRQSQRVVKNLLDRHESYQHSIISSLVAHD